MLLFLCCFVLLCCLDILIFSCIVRLSFIVTCILSCIVRLFYVDFRSVIARPLVLHYNHFVRPSVVI